MLHVSTKVVMFQMLKSITFVFWYAVTAVKEVSGKVNVWKTLQRTLYKSSAWTMWKRGW